MAIVVSVVVSANRMWPPSGVAASTCIRRSIQPEAERMRAASEVSAEGEKGIKFVLDRYSPE